MRTNSTSAPSLNFLSGGGEMGELIRTMDWSDSSIGSPAAWPAALRICVGICLNSKFPMLILWGKDHVQIFNDGYREIMEDWTNEPMGKTARTSGPEKWPGLGPILAAVLETGESVEKEEQLIILKKDKHPEDCYSTFSYSPIRDDSGNIGGVICTVTQSMKPVQNDRNLSGAFTNLFIQAPIALCVFRGNHHIVEVANKRMLDIWGRTEEDTLNKAVSEVLNEVIYENFTRSLVDVYTTGKRFMSEETLMSLMREGKLDNAFFEFVYEPLMNADGSMSGVMVLAHDVTEQVSTRKNKEANEAFNRTVLESNPDCLKVIDPQGRLIFMNKNGLCALEIDDFSSVKNKHWWDIWSLENQLVVKDAVTKALTGEQAYFQVMESKSARKPRWWDVIVSPVMDENTGTVSHLLALSRDITAQKLAAIKLEESEHRYHNMIDSSPSMILMLKGEDMVITVANPTMLQVLGNDANIVGKPLFDIVPGILVKGVKEMLQAVYKTGQTESGYERAVKITRNKQTELRYYNFVFQAQKTLEGIIDGVAVIATEVTTQANFNLSIKESEARFRSLADQVPMFIYIIEPNEPCAVNYWNSAWITYTGQVMADALGVGWHNVIHPDDLPAAMEICSSAFAREEIYLLPAVRIKRSDGVYRWHMMRSNPRYLPDGTFIGYIGIGYDIHESKLAVDALKESEERMRNLVEKATSPICILKGEEMVLVVANDPVFKVWNVDKTALGKPFLEIIPEMKDQPFMGWLLDVFHHGTTHYGNEELAYFQRADGQTETVYFNFVYQPYKEDDGHISGVMVLATDVTEQVKSRKKLEISEAHFRHMTDLMPAKISNAHADGSVIYFNKSWLSFTGKSFEELQEFGYHNIMHPDELEEFGRRLQEGAEAGTVVEMEMRFMNADGEYIWHLNLASPVKDENGNISMWVGVTTEIQRIKEEERLKDNFLSMASHELKTPVTTIKAYGQLAEVMLERQGDTKTLSILNKMTRQIDKLNNLIVDLLDFTKIKKGKLIYHEDWFDFNEFAVGIIEDMQSTSASHTIESAIGQNAQVYGDKDKLGQVLNNLISNAIKYSPKASKISVRSSMLAGIVTLCIKDSGIGIETGGRTKIFEEFYRVSGDNQYTFPGMGIGLFISSEIVKKFEGRLWLDSSDENGSEFCVTIPVDYRSRQNVQSPAMV